MNWMVTGGAGYIGSHLVLRLLEEGHCVVVLDDLSRGSKDRLSKDAIFVEGSILDQKLVETLLRSFQIDGVVHLAAKKSVSESLMNPSMYFDVNAEGTTKIIKACSQVGVNKIVFSSTAAVYKDLLSLERLTENSPIEPLNPYGKSKFLAENYLRETANDGVHSIIFRYFNVVGSVSREYAEVNTPNLIPVIENAIRTKTKVEVFGLNHNTRDGSCIRDYLHVLDVVEAHIAAIDWLEFSSDWQSLTLNLGSGTGYTVLEVIKRLSEIHQIKIPWRVGLPRIGDPASVLCDSTQAELLLGWQASRDPFLDHWLEKRS